MVIILEFYCTDFNAKRIFLCEVINIWLYFSCFEDESVTFCEEIPAYGGRHSQRTEDDR